MIRYKNGMVIIGPFDKAIQSMGNFKVGTYFLLQSLSRQTLIIFIDYYIGIFHRYKNLDKKNKFEYIMKEQ